MDAGYTINPASDLPMISGDTSGVDVGGNPYGMDDPRQFDNNSFYKDNFSGFNNK